MDLSPLISLTDDADLRARLERKLEEYRRRTAPDAKRVSHGDILKRDILARLLADGSVTLEVAMADASERIPLDDPGYRHQFENAYNVINAYATGNHAVLAGGTGLK